MDSFSALLVHLDGDFFSAVSFPALLEHLDGGLSSPDPSEHLVNLYCYLELFHLSQPEDGNPFCQPFRLLIHQIVFVCHSLKYACFD